jgi:hypothetical protein
MQVCVSLPFKLRVAAYAKRLGISESALLYSLIETPITKLSPSGSPLRFDLAGHALGVDLELNDNGDIDWPLIRDYMTPDEYASYAGPDISIREWYEERVRQYEESKNNR